MVKLFTPHSKKCWVVSTQIWVKNAIKKFRVEVGLKFEFFLVK